MAAPDIVAVYSDGGTESLSVDVPSVIAGDWLVAVLGNAYEDSTLPVGGSGAGSWLPIGAVLGDPDPAPAQQNYGMAAYYKIATETDDYTVTMDVPNEDNLIVLHLRGASSLVDVSDHAVGQNDDPAAAQAIGPVDLDGSNALLIGAWGGVQFNAAWDWVPSSPMVQADEVGDDDVYTQLMVATEVVDDTGSSGTRTATATPTAPFNGFAGKLFAISGDSVERETVDLTHVGSSTWVTPANSTTIAPTYPSGLEAGDVVYMLLHTKPSTATPSTPTNWTLVGTATGGAGTQGAGTGATRMTVFKRVVPSGGLSGTQSVTVTGGSSLTGTMHAYRASGTNVQYAETTASWSVGTGSTTIGGTASGSLALAAKDEILALLGTTDDQSTTLTLTGLTASGATLGTLTRDPNVTAINAQGNDISSTAYRIPVTAGSSSSTPVATATSSSSETAMGLLMRVRATAEVEEPPGDGTEAAVVLDWGPVVAGSEDFADLHDPEGPWDIFDVPSPGDQYGIKDPDQVSVVNGVLNIEGSQAGGIGGAVGYYGDVRRFGRWESRVRYTRGDWTWRGVGLLWPDGADTWPDRGEIDYFEGGPGTESGGGVSNSEFTVHAEVDDEHVQDKTDTTGINLRAWNNFAVEWTPDHVRGYLNGTQIAEVDDPDILANLTANMWHSYQLDWMAEDGIVPTTMQVAWLRIYDVEGAPVTGELAATAPAVTAAIAGTSSTTGAVAGTLPAVSASLTGTVTDSAVLAGALPASTAALTAASATPGVVGADLPAVAAELTATSSATGAVDATLPAVGGVLTGTGQADGSLEAIVPAVTAALAGQVAGTGELTGTAPAVTAALTGDVETDQPLLTALLPAPAAALTGGAETSGVVAATAPGLDTNFTAIITVTAELGGQLPAPTAVLGGSPVATAVLAAVLTVPTAQLGASSDATAGLAAVAPAVHAAITGDVSVSGVLAGTLPQVEAEIGAFGATVTTWDGTGWVAAPAKVWDGAAWVATTVDVL